MWHQLLRILELQPSYSSENTPAMQERGEILRHEIKASLEDRSETLSRILGRFGGDFHVDASDGIGRKTELPWVRFCSSSMSPRPTEGFYFVMHFSTDGSAVHFTVGCGSSRFVNGEFAVLPDEEIDAQTQWAQSVVIEEFGSLRPFDDPADFGARRPLPKSFERATAFSKRIPRDELETTDLDELLKLAAMRLRVIYEAQSIGRDVTPAELEEAEIEALMNPQRTSGRRQGYGLSAPARRAVEFRAMELARQWLLDQGYRVEDRSATKPYDLEAMKGDEKTKVEVKGTTSDRADTILMKRNEVDLHRREKGQTCLIIVSRIELTEQDGKFATGGGHIEVSMGWDIDEWSLEPTAFRVARNGR
ncbi:MAG: DUF3578 domain-containing protein [Sedimentitalea sp.]|uniref:MrcB family domain-containing protein n=1 Tax=Sedimentitalea sp. TaxID=2048915 RepID=UPI0032664D2F